MSDAPERTVRIGDMDTPIRDPHGVAPVSGEVLTELRIIDGVLFVGLGSHIFDGSGPPYVQVVARLRIPLTTLASIQQGIANLQQSAEVAKKNAN